MRNCRGMAVNAHCRNRLGIDLWEYLAGESAMFLRDRLHITGKVDAVFADKLDVRKNALII